MFIEYQLLSLFNFAFMCQENVHARNGLKSRFVIQKSEFVNVKSRKKDFIFRYTISTYTCFGLPIYPLKVSNP